MTHTPEQLASLREKAKELGVANWHNKKYETLYEDTMKAVDVKIAENEKAVKSAPVAQGPELFPFTNAKTGRIGLYIHVDKRNTIPHNEKGTAYVLQRWV